VAHGGPIAVTLAQKIETLFETIRRTTGEPHSNEEVAAACQSATGESFSRVYLWQLRTGRRDNPTKRHLEALAAFFQVPAAYFFDDDQSAVIQNELELLAALRDSTVRQVALRAVTLSPEGTASVLRMIEDIQRRESGAR
jgi:transcriptional regulator with XRE-family HTH domain